MQALEKAIQQLNEMPDTVEKWSALVRAIRALEAIKQDTGRLLGI